MHCAIWDVLIPADAAEQVFDVIARSLELGRQQFQQAWVRWWIELPKIVDRIYDSAGKQVEPQPVGEGGGEIRVFLGGEPVNKRLAEIDIVLCVKLLAAQKRRRYDRPGILKGGIGNDDLAQLLTGTFADFNLVEISLRAAEERGQRPMILL